MLDILIFLGIDKKDKKSYFWLKKITVHIFYIFFPRRVRVSTQYACMDKFVTYGWLVVAIVVEKQQVAVKNHTISKGRFSPEEIRVCILILNL